MIDLMIAADTGPLHLLVDIGREIGHEHHEIAEYGVIALCIAVALGFLHWLGD